MKTRFCVSEDELLTAKYELFREEEQSTKKPLDDLKIDTYKAKIRDFFNNTH